MRRRYGKVKCIQYGFKTILTSGKTLAFLGDVSCSKAEYL